MINTSEFNPYKTKIQKENSKSITASLYERWLYVEGNGWIDEFSVDVNKNDYTLKIVIDDHIVYNELHSWFVTNDALLYNVDTSGSYKIAIRGLYFKESFSIEYTGGTAGTFATIMCRYTIREGKIKK